MFGVDEAGKGPVLGPMVAACLSGDAAALPEGVADSKTLAPARREELAATLRDRFAVGVSVISVDRIDGEEDMNTLTVAAHAEAIEAAADPGETGVCDAGDTSEKRFSRRVTDRVPFELDLTAEHGADDAYPMVAAASIVAKVERDARVARLADEYGEVGSGYPSDPKTRTFLREYVREHGEIPACARASWQTSKDVLAANQQSSLEEF